ncbi:MAG TPA: hypothetical protein ENK72_00550 [Epsilonproteobacteria bacterium]|nr:hypothetical protein [Campylobacterota bacterium]
MKKIGIGIDYSNICKNYNTAYLDRDNTDPETKRCMKQVLAWSHTFLTDFVATFGYNIYHLSSDEPLRIEDVSAKRFHFYSLEKDITLQNFVIQKSFAPYANAVAWVEASENGIMISNDEDGEGVYLYCTESSDEHQWIVENLKAFTLDEVELPSS